MGTLIAALLLAAELTPPPPPPPLPPPLTEAPPPLPEEPLQPQTTRVYLRLADVPEGTEVYDVTRAVSVCRAPCGIWLDSNADHRYQVQADGSAPSSEFALNEFRPGTGVDVDFVPRDGALFGIGLALTIFGGVGVVVALASTVIWLYITLIVALFGGSPVLFEFLYVAAASVAIGAPGLAVGLPLLIKSRSRLDVHEARPDSELPAAR